MNPKTFVVTTSWAQSMAGFPPDLRLEVYDAIFRYVDTGDAGEMSQAGAAAFAFIKADIDIEIGKRIERCEKNLKAIRKRWGAVEKPTAEAQAEDEKY